MLHCYAARVVAMFGCVTCACTSGVSPGGSGGRSEPGAERAAGSSAAGAGSACGGVLCGAGPRHALGAAWHPDPDGDGIDSARDLCPDVYDPAQHDANGDGRGDACDPTATKPVLGGPVVDLHAQHVTPYGAWLSFRSVRDVRYSWKATLAWSTERDGVATPSGFAASEAAGRALAFAGYERAGHALEQPLITIDLAPATTYYLAVRMTDTAAIGNVLEIRTQPSPRRDLPASRPRAIATAAQLAALRSRVARGDRAFRTWSKLIEPRIAAILGRAEEPAHHAYAPAAALLYRATGEPRHLAAARTLLGAAVAYWEANELSGNAYRWADAVPAICLDLLWDELDAAERNRIVAATLADDEANLGSLREQDTDRVASMARTLVIDGLVGCDAEGLAPALATRACAVLERGLRIMFGIQLVAARRHHGFWAQSGGTLPDGTYYSRGTARYWLEPLAALGNAGFAVEDYSPWIENNLLALEIYPLTPSRRGFSTFGDIESYRNPEEPNSMPIDGASAGLVALRAGLLAAAGRARAAGYARYLLADAYPREHAPLGFYGLLADRDDIEPRSYRDELPLAYLDPGVGLFYDRSSWRADASMLVFRAGWSGVDHSHEDLGAFQLFRRGRWVTHEAIAYSGPPAAARGHNVLALAVSDNKGVERLGQLAFAGASGVGIRRASATASYAYAAADTLGVYDSDEYRSHRYAAVQRHLVWLKAARGAERVVVYDLVDNAPGETGRAREWQLHLDAAPSIAGPRATTELPGGQRVTVDVVAPAGVVLAAHPPEGEPHTYPGEVYTHRLTADPGVAPALRMVAVVSAGDARDAPAPAPVALASDAWIGAALGADAVVFPRAPIPEGWPVATAAAVRVPAAVRRVVWTGLAAEARYRVTTRRDGDALALALAPGGDRTTDPGGVLELALP